MMSADRYAKRKRGEGLFAPSIGRIPWMGPSLVVALWMLAGCATLGVEAAKRRKEEEGAQAEQSGEARPM
jgi:hypothetical protein